ncbi:MAG: hypothetical protein AUJ92_14640 [Armatimonadetes bacterium CG2_30_59_28]|nr:beta-ketoacyl-[acyl-carrier-protein] synthase family protein [Armatimonadota bacterium]OIO92297.1 MAG: hypothetical protein AUJ92_14640 [Armatimonadetes bacterium CG2_30_59_28]PIU65299.1 MAG: beta-ketoacyl-[acyl-carrier-protein] synthase II [Armatimonadetes bacterium CG07_land_8_20_14_0_80_59_28]PIX42683.1 MAG: beta-ketoacyl-[acyl-carrier-protein] synthase II [Armatimonadetes bacterium CG_4_8_14_3_um_filter_58_9]
MNRVVITGAGLICCLGSDLESFWERLLAGESGIGPITKFDPTGLRNEEAGEVVDFDWSRYADDEVDEATQFAFAATADALMDAGLTTRGARLSAAIPDIGLVYSTNFGGAYSWESFVVASRDASTGADEAANDFRQFQFQSASEYVRQELELGGLAATLSNSCSSGVSAVGMAFDQLRLGDAAVIVAGGYDSLGLSSLSGLSILRTITAEKCRPFDKNRSGTIFGEGAGMVVLEELDHAKARGASIYAEVLGYSLNNNAYHLTAPDKEGEGMVQVIQRAIGHAGISPDAIDYINAHGTGTQYHDPAEILAIKAVLGDHAYKIPVSSIKAATAHTLGPAGAIELIATVLATRDDIVPPTVNYETPDPDCDLDIVPNQSKPWPVTAAMSLSAGIGGNNGAIIVRSMD